MPDVMNAEGRAALNEEVTAALQQIQKRSQKSNLPGISPREFLHRVGR